MENELKITIEIFPKENKIYIAEESSSGAGYRFNNVKELAEKIYFYLDNYYKEEIEGSKEEYHIINEENIVDYREEIDSNIHNVIKGYILNLIETTYPEILQKNLLSREKIEEIATKISNSEDFNDNLDNLMFEEINQKFNIAEIQEEENIL